MTKSCDFEGFLVNFQAFVELFLSIFQSFSYQNSYDPILDYIQYSLCNEIIKNRVSQSFSKECGFSMDFPMIFSSLQLHHTAQTVPNHAVRRPAASAPSAWSNKKGEKLGFYQQKLGIYQ